MKFNQNKYYPNLPELEAFRGSVVLSREPKVVTSIELMLECQFYLLKNKVSLNYNNILVAIQILLDSQINIPTGVSKVASYPKFKGFSQISFRKSNHSLLSSLQANRNALKGKRAPGGSDQYFKILKNFCKSDISLIDEFFLWL